MRKKSLMAVLMAGALSVSFLAGCGGNSSGAGSAESGSQAGDAAAESMDKQETEGENAGAGESTQGDGEEIVIRLYGQLWDGSTYEDGPQYDDIANAIAEKIGVRISIDTNADRDGTRLNSMLASGDMPDIIMANDKKYLDALINGGNIIALDDLIEEYGQDILKDCPTRIQFSKDYYSMGTGKLYVLPGDAGYNIQQIDSYMGLRMRWDYYKELGCSEYKNYYDVLDILKQMQEAHPTTEDGKKVYGMSGFLSDWNLWSYIVWPEVWQGCFSEYSGFVDVDCVTNEATSYITNPDSTLWNGARIWNMANRMGILDPDSFTQNSDQCLEKYSAGRVLSGWVGFMTSGFDYNMQEAGNEEIGFINMQPPAGTKVYYSGESKVVGKSWALWGITSKCEHPEKAMQLLNLLQSFDGNMMLFNGIEGTDWEFNEEGVPVITEKSFELRETDSEYINRTGIGKYTGWCSLAGGYIHPEYNVPLNLLFQEATFKEQLTPLQQDYCDYYNLDYPAQWLYEEMEDITVHEVVAAALPDTPDDIIRTDDAIMETLKTELLQLVMNATTDEEFEKGREQILEELYSVGLQDSLDFWIPAYAETTKIAQQYGE